MPHKRRRSEGAAASATPRPANNALLWPLRAARIFEALSDASLWRVLLASHAAREAVGPALLSGDTTTDCAGNDRIIQRCKQTLKLYDVLFRSSCNAPESGSEYIVDVADFPLEMTNASHVIRQLRRMQSSVTRLVILPPESTNDRRFAIFFLASR